MAVDGGYRARVHDMAPMQVTSGEKPPDFMLLDTAQAHGTPMEVFGRSDPDYQARAAEKKSYYDQVYGPGCLWSWDATTEQAWPDFPPAVEQG